MRIRLLTALCASVLLLTGCNIIYKQNIQQGNALEQEDLDQLEIGMSKNQVAFLLGTPAIQDPFNQSRWDYLSSFSRRGGDPVRRLVTLKFEDDWAGKQDNLASTVDFRIDQTTHIPIASGFNTNADTVTITIDGQDLPSDSWL